MDRLFTMVTPPLIVRVLLEPLPLLPTTITGVVPTMVGILKVADVLLRRIRVPLVTVRDDADAMAFTSERIKVLFALFPRVIAPVKLLDAERITVTLLVAGALAGNVMLDDPVMPFAAVSVRKEVPLRLMALLVMAPAAERIKVPPLILVVPV